MSRQIAVARDMQIVLALTNIFTDKHLKERALNDGLLKEQHHGKKMKKTKER